MELRMRQFQLSSNKVLLHPDKSQPQLIQASRIGISGTYCAIDTHTAFFPVYCWPRARATDKMSASERLATDSGAHPQGANQRGSPRSTRGVVRTHTRCHGCV